MSSEDIDAANAMSLAEFRETFLPPPITPVPGDFGYRIELCMGRAMRVADFECCYDLIVETSASMYRHSSVGWRSFAKKKEMRDPSMRYLIVRSIERPETRSEVEQFIGFLSFMLTMEGDIPVVYCYEIHMVPSARGRGLGKHLMELMEQVGRGVEVEKAMLTVFSCNKKALKFYKKLGYTLDPSSPTPQTLRDGGLKSPGYVILSKNLFPESEYEDVDEDEYQGEDEDEGSGA